MFPSLPPSWQTPILIELDESYWSCMRDFIKNEYGQYNCFPNEGDIFKAFELTPFEDVKVVILGQDPYHSFASEKRKVKRENLETEKKSLEVTPAAMGLSFSVPNGSKILPSLRNIFQELESDIGIKRTKTDLTDWAEQGVLLLNSVLTVRQGEPGSHQGRGWEDLTDSVIQILSQKRKGIVFILWGKYAIEKKGLIDESNHLVLISTHPSPLSAYRGFFGSRVFSRTNTYLREEGIEEIVWG